MSELSLGKVRGNMWYDGDGITGSSTSPTIFSGSGVTKAYVGDHYLNTDTDRGNVYACVTKGDPTEAEWVYAGTILGPMPEVVNNLESTSTTKALSAAMGKKLKDLLDSCGVQPYTVTPTSGSTAFTASMVIEDFDTTFTVTDMDGNTGTYAYTNGGGTTATVNITIGTSIGLPNNGAVIKAINSSGAKIISYALYDSTSTEIFSETPSLWDHLTADEQNIIPYSDITEGLNTYKSGLISKIISGVRTTLYPVTHAAAVWFNRGANKTVKDAIDQAFDNDADEYDSTSTYAVGDICIYQGALYRCTTAISVAEAWDVTHWTATTVGDEIGRISSDLSELGDADLLLATKFTTTKTDYTLPHPLSDYKYIAVISNSGTTIDVGSVSEMFDIMPTSIFSSRFISTSQFMWVISRNAEVGANDWSRFAYVDDTHVKVYCGTDWTNNYSYVYGVK